MAGAKSDPQDALPEDEDGEGREDGSFPDDENAIEESLHSALNDLERMLTRHEGTEPDIGAPGSEHGGDPAGEQYTIPLLDDVVIPGEPVPAAITTPTHTPGDEPVHDESEPALRARIATRLASELDVIVQDRMEDALERAREEIRNRVRDHMDIILPEIVDELMQTRRREGGG